MTERPTSWPAVLVLFFSACTLAFHQGKVPSALGELRAEFGLSLTAVGSVVSLYAVLIALSGLALGLLVTRVGYVRFAIVGVSLAGVASLVGADAQSYRVLAISRVLEGAGWILSMISMSAIIAAMGSARDRPLVMGLWGGFVPAGTGLMLIAAPWLQQVAGWRGSWRLCGALSLLAALAVWSTCRRERARLIPLARGVGQARLSDLDVTLLLLLSASFFLYSLQFVAVTSFLPTVLVERNGLSLKAASTLVALVILGNVVGNVLAGRLLQLGTPAPRLIAIAAGVSSVGAAIAYLDTAPATVRIVAAACFSCCSGAIPGTLFATMPRAARAPAATALIVGAMLQAAGVGQVLGPIVLPALVEGSGHWSAAGLLTVASGACGIVVARWMALRLRAMTPPA